MNAETRAAPPPMIALSTLGGLSPIARGATGVVYEAEPLGKTPIVLKRFLHPEVVDAEALKALVHWRRQLEDLERAELDRVTAWPIAAVQEQNVIVGFVMRRVPEVFIQEIRLISGTRRTVPREAQYLLGARGVARLGVGEVTAAERLELLCSLVEAVAFLHEHRVVVCDMSTRNVLWSTNPSRVFFVDCDSMFLGGVGSPLPPSFTVDWDDPAQIEAAASSDVYKLALFVIRALAGSFQTRDPRLVDGHLDAAGKRLLKASLSKAVDQRPSMVAWEQWATGRLAALRVI
jgi:eukaryotic-like serine/threonine-protein kinase